MCHVEYFTMAGDDIMSFWNVYFKGPINKE